MANPATTVSGLQPYPANKPSGVEWLGDVPAHWEVRKLKSWLRINELVLPEDTDPNYTFDYVDIGAVGTGFLTADLARIRFRSAPSRARRVLRSGDTIVSTVRTYLKAVWSPKDPVENLIASTGFAVLTPPDGTASRFVGYLCQSDYFADRVTSESVGIAYPAIAETRLGALEVCVPPLSEQAAIARYLDHADGRIRRCIHAKEKLVELLEEQRQTLVNEAVTGQIDVRTGRPYPAYKPSGVEWLGEVPRHWVVASLRHRYQQCLGKMLDTKHISGEHLFPYLRNTDVQWDEINVVDLPTMDIRPVEVGRYTVRRGDLLVCEGGEVGRCAIWDGDSKVVGYQKALHRLRPHRNDRDIPRFMYFTLRSATERAAFDDGHESTIGHLTGDKLRAHRFPFPPFSEQSAIAYYLDHTDQRVRRNIQAARRQIHLLEEYRTRLIADVVTGMLDVRETAIRLPNGVKETGAPTESDAPAKIDPDSARCLGYAPWDSDM